MIEVVVLRCRPVSAHPGAGEAPVPHLRSLKAPTGSLPVGKNLKVVTSLPLSDDSSESSETSGPFIGTFDGAGDEAPPVMSFGGDAAWDEFLPPTPKATQRAGALFSSPATSDVAPFNESSGSASGVASVLNSQWHGRNQSRFHFEQDWSQSGRPGSQITQSPNSPRTQAQGKGGGAAKIEAANASVCESKLSAPGNTIPGEPGRRSPTVQRTHAVIIDTDQEDSTGGPWVFRPVGSAVSLADSWVTRLSRRENGEEKSQASHEPKGTQKPTTSWQAPATWNESNHGGQPSDDKQEIPRGSASRKSLVNLLIRSDTGDKGNKDLVRQSILLKTSVSGASLTFSRRVPYQTLRTPALLRADGQSKPLVQLWVLAIFRKARRGTAGIVYPQLESCPELGVPMMRREPTTLLVGVRTWSLVDSKIKAQAEEATRVVTSPRRNQSRKNVQRCSTPVNPMVTGRKKQSPMT